MVADWFDRKTGHCDGVVVVDGENVVVGVVGVEVEIVDVVEVVGIEAEIVVVVVVVVVYVYFVAVVVFKVTVVALF